MSEGSSASLPKNQVLQHLPLILLLFTNSLRVAVTTVITFFKHADIHTEFLSIQMAV